MKLSFKIAELEIQSMCVPGHGIEELVYALCCQSNEVLKMTEVKVPVINGNISE